MANVYTLDAYRVEMNRRIANTRRRKNLVIGDVVEYVANVARKLAPVDSGKLRRGIKQNKTKGTVTARAHNKGFPYIHWVNQTKGMGMRTLTLRRYSNGRFAPKGAQNAGTPFRAVYGQAPATWRFTGKARFFDLAVMEGRKRFLPEVRKRVLQTGLMGRV